MGRSSSACPSSSSSQVSSILCCMCGDHGLEQELFQCKICFARSQHKYCSDLYPRKVIYRACNWCLREEGGKMIYQDDTNINGISKQSSKNDNQDNSSAKPVRREYLSRHNKPIKKNKEDKKPLRILIRHSGSGSKELESQLEIRGKRRCRPKARRYRLLEEFTS
ncbi:hypothetical protein LUZ60_002668 [Juncus effusus]|nr:hypothetical protein LUZ60_002668 [Juncus effusus]